MTMSSAIHTPPALPAPARTRRKGGSAGKQKAVKGIFGLLPEWKVDTQALKDELRD
jgi:hypothetical protein